MNPRKMKVEIKKKRKIGYTMISFCVSFLGLVEEIQKTMFCFVFQKRKIEIRKN